jgi:biotin operon repressor
MSLKRIAAAIDCDLPSSEKLVLILLANNAKDEDGTCFPSQKYLAKKSGFARGTVNGIIKRLKKSGLIDIVHQYRDDGGLRANSYTVFPDYPSHPESYGVVLQGDRGMSSTVTAINNYKESTISKQGVANGKNRKPSAAERALAAEQRVIETVTK